MVQKATVYLAGQISADPQTYAWRKNAAEMLRWNGFSVVDPCENVFNQTLIKAHKDARDSTQFTEDAIAASHGILLPKDYQLVVISDIILVNLTLHCPEKPMIGTMFELAFAWHEHLPVIGIVDQHVYSRHPFVTGTLSGKAQTVEGACKLIINFF